MPWMVVPVQTNMAKGVRIQTRFLQLPRPFVGPPIESAGRSVGTWVGRRPEGGSCTTKERARKGDCRCRAAPLPRPPTATATQPTPQQQQQQPFDEYQKKSDCHSHDACETKRERSQGPMAAQSRAASTTAPSLPGALYRRHGCHGRHRRASAVFYRNRITNAPPT